MVLKFFKNNDLITVAKNRKAMREAIHPDHYPAELRKKYFHKKGDKWLIRNKYKEDVLNYNKKVVEKKELSEQLFAIYDTDTLTFGKFKGQKYIDTPRYYLKWLIKEKPQTNYKEYAFRD